MSRSAAANEEVQHWLGAREALRTASPEIEERRERSAGRLRDIGLPSRRHESWKYTDLRALNSSGLAPGAPQDEILIEPGALERFTYWENDHPIRLVFVDGSFRPEFSQTDDLPEGVRLDAISTILSQRDPEFQKHLGLGLDEDDRAFALLNSAMFQEGAFLRIAPKTRVKHPIHLLYLTSGDAAPATAHVRNLIVAEASSEVTFVERYAALNGGELFFTNAVTEVVARDNARVKHVKILREAPTTTHFSSIGVLQDRSSHFESVAITVDGAIARNDLEVRLCGEGAECDLKGLQIVREKNLVDQQINVRHEANHTRSEQLYRAIATDRGTSVFNGGIRVPEHVLGSEAEQTSANLLLSPKATVNTKPQLAIDADDVVCSHGATVGALDDAQLFYLRSRGIPKDEAQQILTAAFVADITEALGLPLIEERLRGFLADRLDWTAPIVEDGDLE